MSSASTDGGMKQTLRGLNATDQRRLALLLADLALPFGDLADLTERPLSLIATDFRDTEDPAQVDRLRRQLWDSPALHQTGEPTDFPSWCAYGAVVAWIYAADALCTSPSDGLVNTFVRLTDLLDALESDLEAPGLCDRLEASVVGILAGNADNLRALGSEIVALAKRLGGRT